MKIGLFGAGGLNHIVNRLGEENDISNEDRATLDHHYNINESPSL